MVNYCPTPEQLHPLNPALTLPGYQDTVPIIKD